MSRLPALIVSVIVGALTAAGAAFAVVSTVAPNDNQAVTSGYTAPVDPGDLLDYGG